MARTLPRKAMTGAAPRIRRKRLSWRSLAVMDNTRPALMFDDMGRLVLGHADDPDQQALYRNLQGSSEVLAQRLEHIAQAVGRIDNANGMHLGTGLLVAPGIVVTARHVAHGLNIMGPTAANRPFVDFRPVPDATASPLRVTVLNVLAGDISHGGNATPDLPDIAILQIDPVPGVTPVRINVRNGFDPLVAAAWPALAVIGFPAFPAAGVPAAAASTVERVFGEPDADHFRRKCLGLGQAAQAQLSGTLDIYCGHDCATMPGCSGGPVIEVASGDVVGVHVSGEFLSENNAQVFSATVRHFNVAWTTKKNRKLVEELSKHSL